MGWGWRWNLLLLPAKHAYTCVYHAYLANVTYLLLYLGKTHGGVEWIHFAIIVKH